MRGFASRIKEECDIPVKHLMEIVCSVQFVMGLRY